jgi:hypothetical protein
MVLLLLVLLSCSCWCGSSTVLLQVVLLVVVVVLLLLVVVVCSSEVLSAPYALLASPARTPRLPRKHVSMRCDIHVSGDIDIGEDEYPRRESIRYRSL